MYLLWMVVVAFPTFGVPAHSLAQRPLGIAADARPYCGVTYDRNGSERYVHLRVPSNSVAGAAARCRDASYSFVASGREDV